MSDFGLPVHPDRNARLSGHRQFFVIILCGAVRAQRTAARFSVLTIRLMTPSVVGIDIHTILLLF